jgi:hypothetical protein
MGHLPKRGSVEVVTETAPEAVWRLVSDPTKVGEWSHECHEAEWIDGADAAAPGARFRGRNKVRRFAWSRTNEVVAVDAPREIAWRTVPTRTMPDSTEWHIRVEPVDGGGARIVQSFVVLKLNPIMDRLFYAMTPEHRDRTAALRDDLERLGKVAGELA